MNSSRKDNQDPEQLGRTRGRSSSILDGGFVAKKHTFLTVTLLSLVPIHSQAKAPDAAPARGRNFDASLSATTSTRPSSSSVALARDPARGTPTMLVASKAAPPPTALS